MRDSRQTTGALMLVALALVIGIIVLAVGFDDPDEAAQAGLPQPTATPEPTPEPTVDPNATPLPTETPAPSPTPTPDPDRIEPSTVRVLVANGTDVPGRASAATDLLIATYGYNAFPTNVSRDVNELADAVYHLEGFEANAREIADLLEIELSAIAPMPSDPPVEDLDDADILVILGIIQTEPEPTPGEG